MSFIPVEITAIEASLKPVGAWVAEKGIGNKSFNDLSRDEVLGLFATVIRTFRAEFETALGGDVPF